MIRHFKYRAKRGLNEILEGSVSADSRDEAVNKINDLGLIPVDLWDEGDGRTAAGSHKVTAPPLLRQKKVASRSVLTFYRQLSRLIQAGISILRALSLLRQENEDASMRGVLDRIHGQIREGATLSASLTEFPKIFSSFDVAMIQTGEAAGRLDEVLVILADYHENQNDLVSKVRNAMIYPSLIVAMGAFTVFFMLTNVIPKFTRLFNELGQELPLLTRCLVGVSDWFQSVWIWGLIFLGIIAVFIRRGYRHPKERYHYDRMLLGVPRFGRLILRAEIARLSRALELLIKNGIPLIKATKMAGPIVRNHCVRREIERCYTSLEQGGALSQAMGQSKIFPGMVRQLVSLGEESGKLEAALAEIAGWYEKDVGEEIKIMTGLLEPIVILIVGLILTLIIVAVLLPVFSLNTMVV